MATLQKCYDFVQTVLVSPLAALEKAGATMQQFLLWGSQFQAKRAAPGDALHQGCTQGNHFTETSYVRSPIPANIWLCIKAN